MGMQCDEMQRRSTTVQIAFGLLRGLDVIIFVYNWIEETDTVE